MSQDELHYIIRALNLDSSIHWFLVQHPLPAHLDFGRALLEMGPRPR